MTPDAQCLNSIRVLCVEDSPDDTELLEHVLERADTSNRYLLTRVDEVNGFVAALDKTTDVILCDYHLPGFSPQAVLKILQQRGSDIPVVILTHAIGEEAAVNILRLGAEDYVTKDSLAIVPQVIARVLEDRRKTRYQRQLTEELDATNYRLKTLSGRLVLAQERERTLISHELHDVLGQTLTGMLLHLRAAKQTTDPQAAIGFQDTAIQMAQEAIEQVKTLSFGLRPAQLDLLGLSAAVQSAVQRLTCMTQLQVTVDVRGQEPRQLKETASVVVRLVQESLTNVLRHAKASRVRVRLRYLRGNRYVLAVSDDGVGFEKIKVLNGVPDEHNLGLYGMIERTELAGGRFSIRTAPGKGTLIRAVL